MKNKVHICHHNDLDGYGAAAIAYRYCKFYKLIPDEVIIFHEMKYGKEFPFIEIGNEDVVIIVDYSLPVKEMQKLLDITPCVIWIDHHKTAIEMYDNDEYSSPYSLKWMFDEDTMVAIEDEIYSPYIGGNECVKPYEVSFRPVRDECSVIPGLRSISFCGAVNTWIYFELIAQIMNKNKRAIQYCNDVRDCFIFPLITEDTIKVSVYDIFVPYLLTLINDWDLWIRNYSDSESLNTFFTAHKSEMHPSSHIWYDLQQYVDARNRILREGSIMAEYRKAVSDRVALSNAFKSEIDGVPVIALNTTEASSDAFNSVKDDPRFAECKAMIRFCLNSDHKWEYSMYSTEIDVSEICKNHGGGGHKGAAGFVSDTLIV